MKKALLGLSNNISQHKEKIRLWSESFRQFSDGEVILLAANATEDDIQTCVELNIKYEIVTVEIPQRRGEPIIFSQDEEYSQ